MDQRDYALLTRGAYVGDPLPEGYRLRRAARELLVRECAASPRSSVVDAGPVAGVGTRLGPFRFESYVGDVEPQLPDDGPLRRACWQPLTRTDCPPGWGRELLNTSTRLTGFAEIVPGATYDAKWVDHARRHAKRWRKEKGTAWELVIPTLDEFVAAYMKSSKALTLKLLFSADLKEKIRAHGPLVRLFGVRRAGATRLEAGFACVDAPEAATSLHFISFIHTSARRSPVGVGLMDEWFASSVPLGLRFLDFGLFWAPGDPRSWKGFSRFKAQFGIRFIRYPRALVRWVGSLRGGAR
jgi:hypothetical protein